ncbi:Ankyrin repeat protein [Rubripirellula lacrimiformis]|uniref:Ankyrin repeat protein n=1 Tax=Rubripirellula lacrimiformis TaxID=1930273 RepID=A0A517NJC0_9BACT|nr:ankyrin repeat domain-containing protein [Rubripirellula lacrimiformis]QDT07240.1 Ankyrin repeat protein [Rubripirellula lacrimiformis]
MIQTKLWIRRVVLLVLPALLAVATVDAAQTGTLRAANREGAVDGAMIVKTGQNQHLHERLCQLNPNWSGKDLSPTVIGNVGDRGDEVSLIQTHFAYVIQRLKVADVRDQSSVQREQRSLNIQRLQDYMTDGVFPQNIFTSGRRPVFIDPWGTHCAVGHLIASSGHRELAKLINQQHRLDVLHDIQTDGLSEWQMASGLSMDELALIQPHYAFRKFSQTIQYPLEIESLILGDSTAVTEALKSGKLRVDSRCGGKTLLHFAAAAGDLDLVKSLVAQGADLEAVSTLGCDEDEVAKGGNHSNFEVRWDAPTLVTKGRYSHKSGSVYETTTGAFVADVLQDLYGGMEGKSALAYATATPRASRHRFAIYNDHRVGGGLWGSENRPLDSLKQSRSEVAQWLQEQESK